MMSWSNSDRCRDGHAVLDLADVATLARTAVERDDSGDVVSAHAPDRPADLPAEAAGADSPRLVRRLARPGRRPDGQRGRCAGPTSLRHWVRLLRPGRRRQSSRLRTADVVKRLELLCKTVDWVLQEAHLLSLLVVDEEPYGMSGALGLQRLADEVSHGI